MKHINVLEFLNAVIVEPDAKTKYYPAIYMLLELASGGDLFDKIGEFHTTSISTWASKNSHAAPDIGIDEDIAQFYFLQLISGLVCFKTRKLANSTTNIYHRPLLNVCFLSDTFMIKVFAIATSSPKIFFSTLLVA